MTGISEILRAGAIIPPRRALVPLLVAVFASALFSSGCGYHVAGRGEGRMPGDIVSLSIPFFKNRTQRPDIERVLTTAFINEFMNTVEVVGESRGEAILEGVVKSYTLTPVSYTKSDVIQEYRLSISLSLRLSRSSDNAVLWEDGHITDYEDFRVDTADVNATKEAERRALEKMGRDTARLVKERMLENF